MVPCRAHDLLFAAGVPLEVVALIGNGTVRAIAMAPLLDLGLGEPAMATGGPIEVPVGDAVLGRMLDVFGAPIDRGPVPDAAAILRDQIRRNGLVALP